jgi:hypothetical protein
MGVRVPARCIKPVGPGLNLGDSICDWIVHEHAPATEGENRNIKSASDEDILSHGLGSAVVRVCVKYGDNGGIPFECEFIGLV